MAKDVRERMVAGATQLLASKGLQATSFSEVIELTDTPRGSIYHHFPGGKDEMVLAALEQSRGMLTDLIEKADSSSARSVLDTVVAGWRHLLLEHEFTTGCAVAAVTVATDSEDLIKATGEIFAAWCQSLAAAYREAGLAEKAADQFAATTMATVEGAVVLSRAQRSIQPFDQAVGLLPTLLDALG